MLAKVPGDLTHPLLQLCDPDGTHGDLQATGLAFHGPQEVDDGPPILVWMALVGGHAVTAAADLPEELTIGLGLDRHARKVGRLRRELSAAMPPGRHFPLDLAPRGKV